MGTDGEGEREDLEGVGVVGVWPITGVGGWLGYESDEGEVYFYHEHSGVT